MVVIVGCCERSFCGVKLPVTCASVWNIRLLFWCEVNRGTICVARVFGIPEKLIGVKCLVIMNILGAFEGASSSR